MFGNSLNANPKNNLNFVKVTGIVQQFAKQLLNLQSDQTIKLSIYEIYDERIQDLLNPKSTNLKLMEYANMPEKQLQIKDLTEIQIGDYQEFNQLLKYCMGVRNTRETKGNSSSSRSHLCIIFQYSFQDVCLFKVQFWDLAGSERFTTQDQLFLPQLYGNVHGINQGKLAMKREYSSINRSLATLGRIIKMLTKGLKENNRETIRLSASPSTSTLIKKTDLKPLEDRIPYRDSKLTRLLKYVLESNCSTSKIILVTNLSPSM